MTKDFDLEEFRSKDGADFPEWVLPNIRELARNLQVLRDNVQAPVTINSGYRSPAHNKAVGGASGSYHLKGMAADIAVKGLSPNRVADIIEDLIELGLMKNGGLGRYNTFCHYDIRGVPGRWDYRT